MQRPTSSAYESDPTRLAEQATRLFEQEFRRRPQWLVAAPGRVNLIGEHTDYNGGFVLPMAIERYTIMAAGRPAETGAADDGHRVQLYSSELDSRAAFTYRGQIAPGEPNWTNYVRGVVAGFLHRGITPGSFNAVVASSVPVGGGLSSSAAMEVAAATLIESMTERTLDLADKAKLCQQAEHDFAGMPSGIMDQFTSIMARHDHLLLLDCRSLDVRFVEMIDPSVTVLIINSNVQHELADHEGGLSPYAQRRKQCEEAASLLGVAELRDATLDQVNAASLDPVIHRRARHVVSEIARTVDAAGAIEAGRWSHVGELMYASHASLRDDYEVSVPELDLLVDLARDLGESKGVYGSRMTGGGFGGCTVSLVRTDAVDAVAEHILGRYREAFGRDAAAFTSRPAQGARVLSA